MEINGRVKVVDIAKGICILLVIFNHGALATIFPKVNHALAIFRMPLFFFLSGIFFNEALSFRDKLARRSDYLIKPYLCVLVLDYFIRKIISGNVSAWELEGILYADSSTIRITPLWYLSHLWLLHLTCHVFLNQTNLMHKSNAMRALSVALLLVSGVLVMEYLRQFPITIPHFEMHPRGLPFGADLLLLISAYFLAGRFCREYIIHFKPVLWITVLAMSVFLFVVTETNTTVSLAYRVFDNSVMATLGSIAGGYLTITLAYWVSKHAALSKVFSYLGLSSLFLLIFHESAQRAIHHILDKSHLIHNNLLISVIAFIGCIIFSLTVRLIVINNNLLALFLLPLKSNKWCQSFCSRLRGKSALK